MISNITNCSGNIQAPDKKHTKKKTEQEKLPSVTEIVIICLFAETTSVCQGQAGHHQDGSDQ